jgi:hypothetical protein
VALNPKARKEDVASIVAGRCDRSPDISAAARINDPENAGGRGRGRFKMGVGYSGWPLNGHNVVADSDCPLRSGRDVRLLRMPFP